MTAIQQIYLEQGIPMRIGFLSSAMALLTGMSTALGQPPATPAADKGHVAQAQADSAAPAADTNGAKAPLPPPPPAAPLDPTPNGDAGDIVAPPGAGFIGTGRMDNRFYGKSEYLLWRLKDAPQPLVATTVAQGGAEGAASTALPPGFQLTLPLTQTGLDNVETAVILPGAGIHYAGRSGGRFTLGYWLDQEHDCGVEGTYFMFERRQETFSNAQVANLTVTVNVIQNITTTTVINGVVQTTIEQQPLDVQLPAQLAVITTGRAGPIDFWGAELNGRSFHCQFGGMLFDLFAGFRFIDLDERFSVTETIALTTANPNIISTTGPATTGPGGNLPAIPPALTGITTIFTVNSQNAITTRNHFYGAQVGSTYEWWLGPRFLVTGWGKIGAGAMTQSVVLSSFTTTTSGAGVLSGPGGLIGPVFGTINQGHTRYAVVPEFCVNLGYQWAPWLRTTLGYNFMYISTVARPGDQIGFSSSATNFQIAGSASTASAIQPTFQYRDSDFWAQGLNAGVELRW